MIATGSGDFSPTKKIHSNLPHVDIEGSYQFITFRTKESVDNYVKKLHGELKVEKVKQYAIDNYLDRSQNGAFLYGKVVAEIQTYFQSYDKKLFDLIALTIMPNHIHILIRQKSTLSNILRVLKGGSTHIVNKILNRKGQVWSSDYYDKLIRDEVHFSLIYQYIKNNALKAGLTDAKERFYGCYE
ncbi:transposase [Sulfurovum sp.]|jgi:REP element-mobilizing transposase RayT|uniref:transposase n=1 Tax=Sulfurovum sp. TaxID=1969726 RepID=UPI002A3688BD|nr:transposase [Sulfurovum sp.]MDD3499798.1 transposase [Sulfurovum sp.]MDY0402610.1 transposase [Sulfurovum sp.]